MTVIPQDRYDNDRIRRMLRASLTPDFEAEVISVLNESDECPTTDCEHLITEDVFICTGYDTKHQILNLSSHQQILSETISAKPLVVEDFCSGQGDEGHCKYCNAGGAFFNREEPSDTLFFCENCGLFIDLGKKILGYTEDWTN